MLREIVKFCDYLTNECSEFLAESIIECIQYKLSNGKADDFSSGAHEQFCLLSVLVQYGDNYIYPEYDTAKNFDINFDVKNNKNESE